MLLQRLQDLKLGCVFLPDSFRLVLVHTKVRRRGLFLVDGRPVRKKSWRDIRETVCLGAFGQGRGDRGYYLESLDGFIESMKYSVPLGW